MAVTTSAVLIGAAVASIAATAAGTYVQYQGLQEQKQTAKEVSRYNQKLAENEAIQTEMEAREQARRASREGRRFMAAQRAAVGKSGIAMAGSPLEVLGQTAGQIELQQQDEARAARARATTLRSQGSMGIYEAAATNRALGYQQMGTLLSGASQIAGQVGSFKYYGVGTGTKKP